MFFHCVKLLNSIKKIENKIAVVQEILVSLQDELSVLKTKFATDNNNNNKRNKKKAAVLSLASERETVNNNITLPVNAESNINENNEIGTASTNSQSFDNKWITFEKMIIKKRQGRYQ